MSIQNNTFGKSNIADSLSKIKDMSKSVAEGKKTWQDLFDTLPEGEKHLAKLGKEMEGQIITEEGLINANKKARESAIAHNNALKQQTLGAKAATVATKDLATFGNMLAMWAITKGIILYRHKESHFVNQPMLEKLEWERDHFQYWA